VEFTIEVYEKKCKFREINSFLFASIKMYLTELVFVFVFHVITLITNLSNNCLKHVK